MEQKIKNLIADTLDYILKNPAIFFSEGDVQAIFYARMMADPDLNLGKLYDIDCSIGLNNSGKPSDTNYKTTLLHREYGTNHRPNSRIDLVIFNPDDVRHIIDPINLKRDDPNNTNKQIYLSPDYMFEFGTDKSAGSNKVLKTHIVNDLEKLDNAEKQGYLIHIQRNYLLGKNSDRNKLKHDTYAETLALELVNYPNVKVLYFKIDVGGVKRSLYKEGKVKFFMNGNLQGVNQNHIKQAILNAL